MVSKIFIALIEFAQIKTALIEDYLYISGLCPFCQIIMTKHAVIRIAGDHHGVLFISLVKRKSFPVTFPLAFPEAFPIAFPETFPIAFPETFHLSSVLWY